MNLRTDVTFEFDDPYWTGDTDLFIDGKILYKNSNNEYVEYENLNGTNLITLNYKAKFMKAYKKACFKKDLEELLK